MQIHRHIPLFTTWSYFNKHVCGSKMENAFNYAFLLVMSVQQRYEWTYRTNERTEKKTATSTNFPINILNLFVLSIRAKCIRDRFTNRIWFKTSNNRRKFLLYNRIKFKTVAGECHWFICKMTCPSESMFLRISYFSLKYNSINISNRDIKSTRSLMRPN